jgi:hypothetical protein
METDKKVCFIVVFSSLGPRLLYPEEGTAVLGNVWNY